MIPARPALLGAMLLLGACDSGTEDRRDVSATRAVMRPHVPVPPGAP